MFVQKYLLISENNVGRHVFIFKMSHLSQIQN